MLGSSLKSVLSTTQVVSPTFRVPRSLTLAGTVFSAPFQIRSGTASQVISIFCPSQLICRRLYFTWRRCALLLQPPQCLNIALRRVALGLGLRELSLERQNLLAISAALNGADISLGRPYLCERFGCLAARVGVIELHHKLTLIHVVAFPHQQFLNRSSYRGMRFETLQRLNFSVGGNNAANRARLHCGRADWDGVIVRHKRRQQHHGANNAHRPEQPAMANKKAAAIVSVSCHG